MSPATSVPHSERLSYSSNSNNRGVRGVNNNHNNELSLMILPTTPKFINTTSTFQNEKYNLNILANMEEMRPPGADDGTRAQPESADGAVGLGYSLPVWKKNFQGAEASSSSMNFISFTKAGTNLDGSQSSARNDYEAKNVCIDVSKLKLVGHIPPAEILEAKTLVEKIHINLKRIINSPINQNNSLTTNFSNSIQVGSSSSYRQSFGIILFSFRF